MKNIYEVNIRVEFDVFISKNKFNFRKFKFEKQEVKESHDLTTNCGWFGFPSKTIYAEDIEEIKEKYDFTLKGTKYIDTYIEDNYWNIDDKNRSFKIKDIALEVENIERISIDRLLKEMDHKDFMEYLRDSGIGLRIDDIK